jgi:serine/threonine protein kinase
MKEEPFLSLHWLHATSSVKPVALSGHTVARYLSRETQGSWEKACPSGWTLPCSLEELNLVLWDTRVETRVATIPLLFAGVAAWKDPIDSSSLLVVTAPCADPFVSLHDVSSVWIFALADDDAVASVFHRFGLCGAIQLGLPTRYAIQSTVVAQGATATLHIGELRSEQYHRQEESASQVIFKSYKFGDDNKAIWRLSEFRRELSCLLAVQDHKNIVRFHGVFLDNSHTLSMQMDYYAGGDLFDAVKFKGAFIESAAYIIMTGLMQALDHIHRLDFVHRDVTAQNILLASDGTPILTDFGLCCHISDVQEMSAMRGSPGYAAPEVCARRSYGPQADCFSAGVVLFFALSGRLPFDGKNMETVLLRTMTKEVKFAKIAQFADVSSDCKDFITRLLQKDPERRPTSSDSLEHMWITPEDRSTIDTLSGSVLDGSEGSYSLGIDMLSDAILSELPCALDGAIHGADAFHWATYRPKQAWSRK